MKKIQFLLGILLLTFAFVSCDPNDSNSSSQNDDTFAENFGSEVSKDFIGQVIDSDNNPIQNVEIKIGTSTVQTDVNGVFIINGAAVHEKFAYITAKKTGYIDGSRTMVPTSGKNNVKIMMIANAPVQTVQSGVDSEVTLPSGTKVNFDGDFQDESGNSYTGSVSVSMFHLLPSNENIDKLMPGSLYAQTKTNSEAILETFGMLNVELRGSGGQKLNIANGHTAEITMKIDDSQLATVPSSIPLWHFDEAKGYWKEEGVATKVGDKYVGEVSHFSWWNCDAFSDTVSLTVMLVDAEGNPLPSLGVGLITNSNSWPLMGYTDNNGQGTGLIPANQSLTLNVYTECGVIYTTTIGPFTSNIILPTITVGNSAINSVAVRGVLTKCNTEVNVTNGYVILTNNGRNMISPVTNGAFEFNTVYCNNITSFTLEGIDFDATQGTGVINYDFSAPVTDVGNLMACNNIEQFISYTFGDEHYIITSNLNSQQYLGDPLLGYMSGQSVQFDILGNYGSPLGIPAIGIFATSNAPGNYTLANSRIYFRFNNGESFDQFRSENSNLVNSYNLRINKFGAIGDYIDVSFSGTITNYGGPAKELHIIAHVLRDY